jgi:hypothetical protein
MALDDPTDRKSARWVRLLCIGSAVAFGASVLMVIPDCLHALRAFAELMLPLRVLEWVPVAKLAAVVGFVALRPARVFGVTIPASWWTRLDGVASWVLRKGLPLALGSACVLLLAGWVPHYLTWPLWTDPDQFAVSALAWDAGILPYRDLPDFDFPGPIYLFWVLGKVFGWGKTAPFYAADAALVVGLGAALVAWSRRRFGRALPGLLGFLVFVNYYLSLDYKLVAQRDWHAAACVVLAWLALRTWTGPAALLVSAPAAAFALAYRPQAVLFLPALLSAVDEGAREPGEPWVRAAPALEKWLAAFAVSLGLAFAPLARAGVLRDFVRTLRVTRYGGPYNRVTWETFLGSFWEEVSDWRTFWLLAALCLMAAVSTRSRRPAVTGVLALAGALLYKPLSPVPHAYLDHPRVLVWSVDAALLVGCLVRSELGLPAVRLLLVLAVLTGGVSRITAWQFRPWQSAEAVRLLARGEAPSTAPPGCLPILSDAPALPGFSYSWQEYREILDYLRRNTAASTRVANFLRRYPFPTINGSVGRLSPFPAAGGILWLEWVAPDDEDRFIRSLRVYPEAVVVWVPGETCNCGPLRLERVERVIRSDYRPEARFGTMEVWRRKEQDGGHFPRAALDPLSSL